MRSGNFTDEFKRSAVAPITKRERIRRKAYRTCEEARQETWLFPQTKTNCLRL